MPSFCRSRDVLAKERGGDCRDCVARGAAAEGSFVIHEGRVLACGRNDGGQRGDAQLGAAPGGWPRPRDVGGLVETTPVVSIAAGCDHTALLDCDGVVWECGRDSGRDAGAGPDGDRRPARLRPARLLFDRRVVRVAAGDGYTLALTTRGELYTWGRGGYGELAAGPDETRRRAPSRAATPARFARVSAGPHHALAVSERGDLYAWGRGVSGASGLAAADGEPLSAAWYPTRVDLGDAVVADASAGGAHSLVLVQAPLRVVLACGDASNGRCGVVLGNPPRKRVFPCAPVRGLPADVVEVSAGGAHSLARTAGGVVFAWGKGGRTGQDSARDVRAPTVVGGALAGRCAVGVSALAAHSLVAATTADGALEVFAFGRGDQGRCGAVDAFGRADVRDRALPAAFYVPPRPRLHDVAAYHRETERLYPRAPGHVC